jgi:hypothetical protein
MPNLKNPTSSHPGSAATGGSHQFVTPVVRETSRPTVEPQSFSSVW